MGKPAYSVLDLAPVKMGGTIADSFGESLTLARHAEAWGYRRYWLAEHHNMAGIASAATAVLIGHVAGGTSTIRVGSGGIMLPNHPPLVIAEQFGTLETLYPGRIDLGLGRAPGSDGVTARALRRRFEAEDDFPRQVEELLGLLGPATEGQLVRAVPGTGTNVPVWLLGSSTYSAQLAAKMGLPFAFAAHFAPQDLMEALRLYRSGFQPSVWHSRPYTLVCVPVVAADTDEEARRLATSMQQAFLNLVRGKPSLLPPPVDSMDGRWSAPERELIQMRLAEAITGSSERVEHELAALIARTQPDEIMVSANIYDAAARLRSYELVASAFSRLRYATLGRAEVMA